MPIAPDVRPSVPHLAGTPQNERELAEKVMANVETFEQGMGRDFRELCTRRYVQYRGFRKFADVWTRTSSQNDRDEVLHDAKKDWGSHLHIPLSFRTIETMVPAAIAHRPRLLYLPARPDFEQDTAAIRLLIDRQQENIDIDLAFQAVMRAGKIYGLGASKTYWRTEHSVQRPLRRRMFKPHQYVAADKLEAVKTFDDPMFEDIDVFDLMWDPFGNDPASCGWMAHRVWMSTAHVLARVESGAWNTDTAKLVDEETLRRMGGDLQRYDEVWQERMQASGFSNFHFQTRGEHPHEVIEWHDGTRVLTVLDRTALVQDAENATVGVKPFQVYRPTPLQKQMVGIGDLEPLEPLQRELDTLRSQRRDAATLALAAGYAFDSSAVDEDDIEFGPGAAIPVNNARPDDAIMPLRRQEVPGSSYQEEQVIRQDFDVVPGLQDAMQPGGVAGTATEAQLVQASLSRRVALTSRRFEVEVVRQAARAFLRLNQRMILEKREPMRVPQDGLDFLQAAQTDRWRWVEVGPRQLRGEWEIIPEGGSMAAKNIPQDRSDAVQVMQLFGQNPYVDPRRPLMEALRKFGVDDPESWLKQPEKPVPPAALEALKKVYDPAMVDYVVAQAQAQDPMLAQEGPQTADVQAMMSGDQGGGGPQEAQAA